MSAARLRSGSHLAFSLIIVFVFVFGVRCNFALQPEIRADKELLVLESAYDKNITLRLSHDSDLYFGDLNVLDEIRPLFAARSKLQDGGDNGINTPTELPTLESLTAQIINMKRDLIRFGRRLNVIQNRTFGTAKVRRFQRLMAQMRRADARLIELENNLIIDECQKNPCKNGATCFDSYKNFHCECIDGWAGKTCEEDVDECYILAGTDLGCQNTGVCVNTLGSYRCVCSNGYTGTHCRVKNATCDSAQAAEICGHGACVHANNANGYECLCDQGWTKNNVTMACIIDVNECALPKNPCHNGCINLPGSFKCEPCPAGYAGDGITCRDINECATNNGGCSLQPMVKCINTEGSYHCGNCPLGWIGDGRNCEQALSKTCSDANICHPRAKCEYISGIVVCTCPLDWFGHGFGPDGCEITYNKTENDHCANHVCKNNGTCAVLGRGSFCACLPGYSGPMCEQADACTSHPCQNGGTCKLLSGNNYSCSCKRGTTGKRCEIVREICGSIINQESGSITYPTNATHYESFERCAWFIRTAETKVLNVSFTKFHLEAPDPLTGECVKDWLQIHDGRSLTSQLIGRFCGQTLPLGGTILSSHQFLFFWFRSDKATTGEGFTLSWNSQPYICGGNIELSESDTGIIRSPGYPGKTAPNRECEWRLNAPYGYRLVLRIYEAILGTKNSCSGDTLKIFDSDMLLKSICETSQPEPLHTSSNRALVHLHTDDISSDSTFQMHYEVVAGSPNCGGIFTDPTGIISGYMDAPICEYLIQQPPGLKIELNITHLGLIQSTDCVLEKLEIFDGKSDEDPLLKRFCNQQSLVEPLISSYNFLLLRHELSAASLLFRREFVAKYRRVCGEKFFGIDGGVFTTPNYPNPYFDNIICTYDIYGPIDSVVYVNFTDFEMSEVIPSPMSDDANTTFHYGTYVEVHLSNTDKRVFYKGMPLMSLISAKNHIRIVFHAEINTKKARGLRVQYDFKRINCGGILTGNDTDFFKISLVHNIPDYCEWIIEAPAGKHIHLTIDYKQSGLKCDGVDEKSLFIYSNSSMDGSSLLLNSYCESELISEPIHSNVITIILKKPPHAEAFATLAIFGSYNLTDSSLNCGGVFTTRFGIIKSPNWPNNYEASTNCTWIISAPMGHQIELVVKNFTLELLTSTGVGDYLEIRNGQNDYSPLIGKYSGTSIPSRIPSFSNYIYLHFHSDFFIEEKGFYITWQQTKTGCGGKLNSHTGSIHSPNGDLPLTCDWHINVAAGSTVEISVWNAQFACQNIDILKIFDGPNTNSPQLKWNCTGPDRHERFQVVLIEVNSTQNKVLVRYSTENPNDNRFVLEYKTICNNIMPNSLYGVIETPNFPEEYPGGLSCSWDLRAGRNNKISLSFSHLMLEQRNSACNLDYVELIDMRDDIILTSKRLCKQPLEELVSEGNRFLMKFTSDYSISERGFRVEYKRLGCGQHFNDRSGTFNSPNLPYSVDVDCEWYIEAPAGKQIVLMFRELHIETPERNCTNNEIIISEEKNSNVTLFHECQIERTNLKITAPANRLYIQFHTNEKRTRKYFKASFMYLDGVCGGKFYAPSGYIASPNFQDISSNVVCVWDIIVPDAFGMALEFSTISCRDASIIIETYEASKPNLKQDACAPGFSKYFFMQSNHTTIKMTVRNNGQGVFALTYSKQCGGKLNLASGFLRATPNEMCEWELEAPDGELISFDILHLECPCSGTSSCGFQISSDETPKNDTNLNCSNNLTNFVGERFFVVVKHIDFNARFTTLANTCGGKITSLQGVLSAPVYQGSYRANVECVWEIEAKKGNMLELEFQFIDISNSPHCNDDFLEIRTAQIGGKVIGVYCGQRIPSETLMGFQRVWLKFKSAPDSSGGKGFKLSWSYMHSVTFNETFGTVESPPVYSARVQEIPYSWRIFVKRGQQIVLNVNSYSSGLKIFDGFDDSALTVKVLYSPWRFISSSNVVFISTENQYLRYFLLTWETMAASAVKENTTINDCHRTIKLPINARVNLSSPDYPHGYKNNLECEWLVMPEDQTFHAEFHLYEANLENLVDCGADYVRASTSSDLVNWSEKAKMCKTPPMNFQPLTIVRGEPYLKIEFKTDASINGSGFTSLLFTVCGSNMTSSVGTILDTNILKGRKQFWSCQWQITVSAGKRIRFIFDYGNEPERKMNEHCAQYTVIYDGFDDQAPILPPGQICNHPERNIRVVETTTNRAIVKYNMSWAIGMAPRHLWNLTYREFSDCDDEIMLTDLSNWVNISSPRYPNVPHPHTECNWIVIAPVGEMIRADFIDRFDMNVRYCNKEFIEFHDGSTTLARKLGRFCQRSGTILSTSNVLHIHYLTDITEPRSGFQLNISIASCGAIYHTNVGEISSSNYPALGAYPKGSICDYTIKLQQSAHIELNFTDIHLPFNPENPDACDRLEILTYEDNAVRLATYYGNMTTQSVRNIDSNAVIIRFHTVAADNSKYRGFKLKYHVFGACVREFTSTAGHISYNAMKVEPIRRMCMWRINVPKGQRVSLNLSTVQGRSEGHLRNRIGEVYDVHRRSTSAFIFYNDQEMRSIITGFNGSDFNGTRTIRSTDNFMLVTVLLIHDSFIVERIEASFNSDESSLCPRNIGVETLKGKIDLGGLLDNNFYCRMSLELSGQETLTFAIEEFKVNNISSLSNQFAIRFRNDDLYIPFGTLNTNVSHRYISLSPHRGSVIFFQNQEIRIIAFSGRYYRYPCGGTHKINDEVILESPNIDGTLNNVLECVWTLIVMPDQVQYHLIGNFSFTDSCDREYISYYAGGSTSYMEIERICKDTINYNGTMLQRGLNLMIYHATEYNGKQSNFRFIIEKSYKCGSKTSVDMISSPITIDQRSYKNNIECSWEFFTVNGMLLSLQFENRFFIEESINCTKDYLDVNKFVNGLWLPETRFCGREITKVYNSTSNHILITFRTDNNLTGDGFTFRVRSHCNAIYNVTEKTQILHLPEIKHNHHSFVQCQLMFVSNSEDKINVRILSNRNFSSEYDDINRHCDFASFTIKRQTNDDNNNNDDISKRDETKEICRVTELRADKSITIDYMAVENFGFFIEYDLISCGGNITSPRTIRSVQQIEMDLYIGSMNCVWYITAPKDHSVVIRFKYFEMEHIKNCRFDYFAAYKGSSIDDGKIVSKICGNLTQNPPVILIDSNQAVIVAISDDSSEYHGFHADIVFVQNCNEHITLTDGNSAVTLSRQFKINASEELLCFYSVTAPEGYRVSIQLRKLQLNAKPCGNDTCDECNTIELFDSIGTKRTPMGVFCSQGGVDIKRISSYEDIVLVIKGKLPGDFNFEISLIMEPTDCGPTRHFKLQGDEVVTISFPSANKENYAPNTHCTWRVDAQDRFELRFNSFLLEPPSQVTGKCIDYLTIKGQYNAETFCGNATGLSALSNYGVSSYQFTFHSDEATENKGFNITLSQSIECNRTHTDLSKEIEYINHGQLEKNCVEEIRVPEDYAITLFIELISFYTYSCDSGKENFRAIDINTNKTIHTLCSDAYKTVSIFTMTNALRIVMNSLTEIKLFYLTNSKLKPPGCGGKIFALGGEFSNPPYSNRNTSECRWEITVPAPHHVRLRYYTFDMGSQTNCHLDYVQFIEIDPNGVERLAKTLCGQELDDHLYTSKVNRVAIISKKSLNFDGSGWTISFEAYEDDNEPPKHAVIEFP